MSLLPITIEQTNQVLEALPEDHQLHLFARHYCQNLSQVLWQRFSVRDVVCIPTRALSELFGGNEAGRADSSWEGRGESDRSHCGRSAQARHAVSIIDPARTATRFGLTDQADHSPSLAPSPGGGSVANSCR